MKFKAAILVEQNKELVIDELKIHSILGFGQVLVKVKYSGICGSQLGEITGVKGPDNYLPHLLGHEGGAVVLEIGPGVTRVKQDDNVVMHWKKANGIESPTPTYQWGNKNVNAGWVTTFNDYAIVAENRLTPISKDISLRHAALMGCAVLTGFGVVNNDANIKIGQSVVIFGIGGLGLNIIQAASMVSANPIIGIDILDNKLELAKQLGMTHGFNATNVKNINDEINKIVNETGADVVIDTTGLPHIIEQAYALAASQSKVILVGVPKLGEHISIYSLPLHFNKVLKGSHGGGAVPDVDIPRYVNLHKANKLKLDSLITHEFSLEEINTAIGMMKSGKIAGRIMINMGHS